MGGSGNAVGIGDGACAGDAAAGARDEADRRAGDRVAGEVGEPYRGGKGDRGARNRRLQVAREHTEQRCRACTELNGIGGGRDEPRRIEAQPHAADRTIHPQVREHRLAVVIGANLERAAQGSQVTQ